MNRFLVLLGLLIVAMFARPTQAASRRCEDLFFVASPLTVHALAEIAKLQRRDQAASVPYLHRTRIQLVPGENHEPLKTRVSVLLIHGLYNSPKALAVQAAHFRSLGMNVVNLRLEGHFESNLAPMESTIRWQQWLEDGRRGLALARELGDDVLLVGHSTGALTAAWLATETPNGIRGLALFAPAFRVRTLTQFGAKILEFIGINIHTPSGRVLTGRAGQQVTLMANAFAPIAEHASDRLQAVPVWLADTPIDWTIDVHKAESFVQALEREESAPRSTQRIPFRPFTPHDSLPGERNRSISRLLKSMDIFFELPTR